jgi:hypothetical protein
MKRKILYGSLSAFAVLSSIIIATAGDARKTRFPAATEVSIDGMSFAADESLSNDSTLLRRELEKLGLRPPEPFDIPEGTGDRNPVFSEKLVGSLKPRTAGAPKVPRGLTTDHSLRMSGDSGTVEIVTGKLEPGGGGAISARLAADGWAPVSMERNPRISRMLRKAQGKETTVVCLDETEGSFLLLRKLER